MAAVSFSILQKIFLLACVIPVVSLEYTTKECNPSVHNFNVELKFSILQLE